MQLHLHSLGAIPSPPLSRALDPGGTLVLGRDSSAFPGLAWQDDYFSRQHARVWQEDGKWWLTRIESDGASGKAPIYQDAARTTPVTEPWELVPGQWLFIARRGITAFTIAHRREDLAPLPKPPARQRSHSESFPPWQAGTAVDDYRQLGQVDYSVRQRLQVLQEELPRAIERWMEKSGRIPGHGHGHGPGEIDLTEEGMLFDEVAGVISLALQPDSGGGKIAVAFVALDPLAITTSLGYEAEVAAALPEGIRGWRILNSAPCADQSFRPSRQQLLQTLADTSPGGMRVWHRHHLAEGDLNSIASQQDWVLALQLKGSRTDEHRDPQPLKLHGRHVVLYITCQGGVAAPPPDLQPFVRTVCLQISSLLESREQQRLQLQLSRHFSPRLRRLIRDSTESLEPVVYRCTVLFCDRRGSSLAAEHADDSVALLGQLRENTAILSSVAEQIFENEGAIADFAGDAVLGFWGWPPDDSGKEHAIQAIQTASSIVAACRERQEPNEVLAREMRAIVYENTDLTLEPDFQLTVPPFRIGISTGDMAVGNVGLSAQMKIGVFGSPVNFGSRLEGLGKMFQLPVIISEETRNAVGDRALMRKLCHIRPAGFDRNYPIFELVLPKEHGGSGATPDQVRRYEDALQKFTQRKFGVCVSLLAQLVAEGDTGAVWLLKTAQEYQARKPPDDWQGEIIASTK
jgi:class 3 adenylate cyclase